MGARVLKARRGPAALLDEDVGQQPGVLPVVPLASPTLLQCHVGARRSRPRYCPVLAAGPPRL